MLIITHTVYFLLNVSAHVKQYSNKAIGYYAISWYSHVNTIYFDVMPKQKKRASHTFLR